MCIIIDANVAGDFTPPNDDASPVLESIIGGLFVVSGNKVKDELLKCSFRGLYRQLVLAGKLIEFDSKIIDSEINTVKTLDHKSNDLHIVALARVSGARILYSKDKNLHDDFKNITLVPKPKGSVYQNNSHAHLLNKKKCG